jgi:hypothetical protein
MLAGFGLACGGDPAVNVTVNVTVNNGNSSAGDGGPSSTPSGEQGQSGGGVPVDANSGCQGDTCGTGTIFIEGGTNHCPEIFPSAVKINDGTWSFVIAASDSDGDPLTFTWTATGGHFSNPKSSQTTYTCEPGKQTLTATVSDGSCVVDWTLAVTCPS